MYLLHVDELKVKHFEDHSLPPYAILSHTWQNGEVSFQDIQTPEATSMAGWAKVLKCCEIAKRDRFEYVWIDTCCIDKTSSAELSEAINSMFKWYRTAHVCYVYLCDVAQNSKNPRRIHSSFRTSRWFTRGWTLQELIAPEAVVFYSKDWVEIGTKRTLQETISEVTEIPCEVLLDAHRIRQVSIAARMSWASRRYTTRVEDMAYSLMGIFDVNIPTLYGEGHKAFKRLQMEIIKDSRDESIFAWSAREYQTWNTIDMHFLDPLDEKFEILAKSPVYFRHCRGVVCSESEKSQSRPPFSISHKGLHIWLPSIRDYNMDVLLVGLNCISPDGKQIFVALGSLSDMRDPYSPRSRFNAMAYTVRNKDLDTMEDAKEMYIVGRGSFGNKAFSTKYYTSLNITSVFHFEKNTSPETGYRIDSYFYAGKRCSGAQFPHDRTLFFNEEGSGSGYTVFFFLSVISIQDPSVRATIALGTKRTEPTYDKDRGGFFSNNTYQCRIYSGSRDPADCDTNWIPEEKRTPDFGEVFSDDNKFQYFPSDKVERRLQGDYLITMSARTGPIIYPNSDYISIRHYHFLVDIEFSRLSSENSTIPEADVVLKDGSVTPISETPEKTKRSRRARRLQEKRR